MRKMIVAGNWKMNLNIQEGKELVQNISKGLPMLNEQKQVIICPPFTHIATAQTGVNNVPHFYIGAQNCHHLQSGAYTGEVSADMLLSAGATHVIIGHSERREYQNESNELVKQKANHALAKGLQVIFCCGESLATRDAGTQNDFVAEQLKASLFHLPADQLTHVSIAYEPIWAIGTGRTASSEQAQEMHAHIRSLLTTQYGKEVAQNVSLLYGGSCNASNAAELFACPDVDGGLIGGASLKAEDFLPIIEAMMQANKG